MTGYGRGSLPGAARANGTDVCSRHGSWWSCAGRQNAVERQSRYRVPLARSPCRLRGPAGPSPVQVGQWGRGRGSRAGGWRAVPNPHNAPVPVIGPPTCCFLVALMEKACLHPRAGAAESRSDSVCKRRGRPMDEQLRVTVEPGSMVRVAGELDILTAEELADVLDGLGSVTVEC